MQPENAQQPPLNDVPLHPWRIALLVAWSVFVLISLVWNVYNERTKVFDGARDQLRSNYFRDHTLWLWSSQHGGFYVPVTKNLQPSEHLAYLPNRDAVTKNGEKLTLVNPAEALRRYYSFAGIRYGVQGRLSGLKALNPTNDPDPWELDAINTFRRGVGEVSGESDIDGNTYLRLMRPVEMEPGCLRCHAAQGFKLGEVIGGISVSLPLGPLQAEIKQRTLTMILGHTGFWLMGLLGINFGARLLQRRIKERQAVEYALYESEARTSAILETCLDCVITIDRDDRIIGWSGAAEAIFGWGRDEAIGQELADTIIPMQYRDGHRQGLARLLRTGEGKLTNRRIEIIGLRRNGEEFPVELAIAYLRSGDQPIFSAFVRDISDRRQAEERMQRDVQYQQLLNRILEASIDPIPFEQQMGRALDMLLESDYLMLQPKGAIFLANEDASELEMMVYRGLPEDFQFTCRGVLGGVSMCAGENPDETRYSPGCQCFPLRSRDRLLGALLVFWQSYYTPLQEERELITTAAHAIAGLIDRHAAEEQLEKHAYYDQLTGLPNRTLFMDWLSRTVQRARRHREHRFAVLFLDIDRFKNINDSLGHTLGDRMLKEAAVRLLRCVRPSDTVARLGGDEFTVLLDDIEEVADAMRVATRIHEELRQPIRLDDHDIYATTSIGIAINTEAYETPDDVLRDADIAMYQAKGEGPGQTKLFDNAMHTSAVALLRIETELRQAIERQELCVYYQPIVAANSDEIVGFEALVRWEHPVRGLVTPDEFIHVAEETGLIIPVGLQVLHQACEQITRWNEDRPARGKGLYVSVNISGIQLLHPQWLHQLDETLVETGCSTRHLRLELTESVLLRNAELTGRVLLALKKRGIRLYLDDFGTGYSSLSYLHRYPFDALKIDRSFVQNLPLGEEHVAVFRSFTAIGHNFGMDIVAEGVETEIELEEVQRLGCDAIQGYYFGEPLPAEETTQLLADEQPFRKALKSGGG